MTELRGVVAYIVPPKSWKYDKTIRRHGFVGKEIDPKDVYANIKSLLQSEEFRILSEDVRDGYWDLHAKKVQREENSHGKSERR